MVSEIVKGRWIRNERRNHSFATAWAFMAGASAVAGVVVLAVSASDGNLAGGLAALAREGFVWNSPRNVDSWEATADSLNALIQPRN